MFRKYKGIVSIAETSNSIRKNGQKEICAELVCILVSNRKIITPAVIIIKGNRYLFLVMGELFGYPKNAFLIVIYFIILSND